MNNEVSIIQLKENEVKRTIIEGTTYGSTMLTMNKMASGFPKPKEIMNVSLDPDKNRDLNPRHQRKRRKRRLQIKSRHNLSWNYTCRRFDACS